MTLTEAGWIFDPETELRDIVARLTIENAALREDVDDLRFELQQLRGEGLLLSPPKGHWLTPELEGLLGKIPDSEIAKEAGVSGVSVLRERSRRGIESFKKAMLGTVKAKPSRFVPFLEARATVRAANLGTKTAYTKWKERPKNIPYAAETVYASEWSSWADFLGSDENAATSRRGRKIAWRPFREAREWARQLCKFRGITGKCGWIDYATGQTERPIDIPARPDRIYKGEWVSWTDWIKTA